MSGSGYTAGVTITTLMAAMSLLSAPALASDPGVPDDTPYLRVELRAAPFRRETPAETRRRVEAFAQSLGLRLLSYQDNDAHNYAEFKPQRPADGGLWGIASDFTRRRRINAALRRLGEPRETDWKWEVVLDPMRYEEELRSALQTLPEPMDLVIRPTHPLMIGQIWISLSIDGLADPRAYAARLRAEQPAVIEAGVYKNVPVLRIETGSPP